MVNRHQPFESWVFTPEDLAETENQTLHEHLKDCDSCRNLAQALQDMDSQLRIAPMLSPAPGFTARWDARLVAHLTRRQRLQTFWVMLASIGGAVSLLLLTGWMILPLLRTPTPILLAWAYQSLGAFVYLGDMGQAVLTIFNTLFSVIPITVWIAVLVTMGALGALWLVTYQRLMSTRRVLL
ncbi:MAG TPA: hypothetical protein VLA49_04540 [Anaerolineales bacterium]|nr:hypothetical protein [Anaerolineales bacterium]